MINFPSLYLDSCRLFKANRGRREVVANGEGCRNEEEYGAVLPLMALATAPFLLGHPSHWLPVDREKIHAIDSQKEKTDSWQLINFSSLLPTSVSTFWVLRKPSLVIRCLSWASGSLFNRPKINGTSDYRLPQE